MRLRLLLLTPLLLCLACAAPALARTTTDRDRAPGRSLASLLALDDYQIMWLDRIYDGFTRTSAEEDSNIAGFREELRSVEARTPPNEARSRQLIRDISAGEQRIADAFLRARTLAFRTLNRQQQRAVAELKEDDVSIRRDRYRDLLIRSVEEVKDDSALKAMEARAQVPPEDSVRGDNGGYYLDRVHVQIRKNVHPIRPPALRIEPEPSRDLFQDNGGPYTSVIVDCREFGVERSMAPHIRLPGGREVWGSVNVDPDFVIEKGIVVYARSMEDALQIDRAGRNPLIIGAVGRSGGNFRSDPVISERDAERLIRANARDHFLDKFRVIFLVDPGS